MKTLSFAPAAAALAAAFTMTDAHATLALDFTGGSQVTFASALTIGWEFTLTEPAVVDRLGFWDEGSNGLINAHTVGIWRSDATLLASTIIDNTSSPVSSTSPDGRWLFRDITPVNLAPGNYVLGGTMASFDSDLQRRVATSTTIPEVTFVEARASLNSTPLLFPSEEQLPFNDGVFGPNAQITIVPEPCASLLLLCGALGTLSRRRRRT